MARRVDQVRLRVEREPVSSDVELEALNSRQAMRLLEYAQPDDPPRRLNGAGFVIIACFVLSGVLCALSLIGAP